MCQWLEWEWCWRLLSHQGRLHEELFDQLAAVVVCHEHLLRHDPSVWQHCMRRVGGRQRSQLLQLLELLQQQQLLCAGSSTTREIVAVVHLDGVRSVVLDGLQLEASHRPTVRGCATKEIAPIAWKTGDCYRYRSHGGGVGSQNGVTLLLCGSL